MRSNIYIAALLFCVISVLGMGADAAVGGSGFKLEGVQSKEIYGPFVFRSGAFLKLESGAFKLKIISGRSFELVDPGSGEKFGVYEFVPGRMIDIGNVLFTIIDITPIKTAVVTGAANGSAKRHYIAEKKSFFDDTAFGLELGLIENTKYDWKINGAGGESDENLERKSASFIFSKDFVTARLGLITSSEWDNTIAGDGTNFENATMKKGTGWFAGMGIKVPVFKDGRWEGDIFGEVSYSKEDLSLQYGAWEVDSVVSSTVTNGATNVTTTTNYDYKNYDEDATLTETLVMLGASISYEAPVWFIYAGLKTLPWSDSSLDAVIVNGSNKFELTFERNDPVMAYGGGGFIIKGLKCYVEIEGGGVNAVRLGVLKEL
jgi:hypothetical protein